MEKEFELKPLVSVITPCFNQGRYLEEAINSLLGQTYFNWECIIINDGSSDDTEKIALDLVTKDNRLKYIFQDHKGVSAARNNAILESSGKYILPLDADDLISQNYIEEGVTTLEEDDEINIVYCAAEKFGLQNGIWDNRNFDLKIMAYENMIFSTALFRRSDWDRVGGYEDLLEVGEDWDLWLSIIETGGKVVKLPFTGFYYRVHERSKIRTHNWETHDFLDFILKKHIDFFIRQLGNPISLYSEYSTNKEFLERIKKGFLYRIYFFLKGIKIRHFRTSR
jgi:glycosyltransferase involved in cell wall biosynthesis